MKYFKKIGTRSEEEQAMLQAIEIVIESKQIPRNDIPDCLNLDDLIEVKHLVDAFDKNQQEQQNHQSDEDQQLQEQEPEFKERESSEAAAEPVTEEAEVIEEESEENLIENDADSIEQVQPEIDVSEITKNENVDFVSPGYNPFEAPIIERSYNKGDANQVEQDDNNLDESDELENLDESKDPTPLDEASDRTRQKAAEQTADTILKGYARLAPKPFKWIAKVSESKVEKLAFSGHLDLDIEVSEGVTFDDYMKSTNEQVDEIFEVDEDTLEEIREPLIEVLKEQQMELTPQQRLGMAVLSHLMQMFTVAMKLRSQNNRILSYQKELTKLSRTNVA